jgi:beta-lactam-binding protein with PASTA domain
MTTPAEQTSETTIEETTAPAEAEIPDLVGENAAIALSELEELGFTDIQLGSVDEDDTVVIMAANWEVVEQSPEAGTVLATDSTIVLQCTKQ